MSQLFKKNKVRLAFLFLIVFCLFGFLMFFVFQKEKRLGTNFPPEFLKREKTADDKLPIYVNLIKNKLDNADIYNPSKDIDEIEGVVGQNEFIPSGYELAISALYQVNDKSYTIKLLREIMPADAPTEVNANTFDSLLPSKPIIIMITNKDNIINYFAIIERFSALEGNEGWTNYNKQNINAIEIRDLNGDGLNEVLVKTFKSYTADFERALLTFYLVDKDDKNINKFNAAEEIFRTTAKEGYKLLSLDRKTYILNAQPGSGACRLCDTPYIVHVNEFTRSGYFDITSVASEKEFLYGIDAIDYKIPVVKEKLKRKDYFIFDTSDLISNITYNQVLKSKSGLTSVPDYYKSKYEGEIIKWQGKISAHYSQITGIKFCVVDPEHQNININEPCDLFWAFSEELMGATDPKINPNWDGYWVDYILNYYKVPFNKNEYFYDKLYTVEGKINGIDCGIAEKCVPDIDIIDITK